MAEKHNQYDAALETLITGAKRAEAAPSSDFMAKLSADMERHVPAQAAPQPHRTGLLMRFQSYLAASGLAGATAVGIWIGFAMPDALTTFADGYELTDSVGIENFVPSAGLMSLGEEG